MALNHALGNAQVARLVAATRSSALAIQRYAVNVPPGAGCTRVVDWLNASNPHRPNWALTRAGFTWSGSFVITGAAPEFRLTVGDPAVTMSGPTVDMPQWSPSDPAMQTAWSSMYATLRTHEGEHEAIARRWDATLRARLTALDIPVTAPSRAAANARANALVNAEWNAWIAEYRQEMTAIDPYTAPLHCPGAPATPAPGGAAP